MSPSPRKVQCPFCFRYVGTKEVGEVMYVHDYGRRGRQKRCPGAGRTKGEAKALKTAGPPYPTEAPSGGPDSIRPEDIF